MAQPTIKLRMDAALRHEMELICKATDLNITTTLTIFVKKVINEQRNLFKV